MKLNQGDNGRALDIHADGEIELRLPENPTTGFRWRTTQGGGPVARLLEDHFEPGQRPGQPGTHLWRYRAGAPGVCEIKLEYRRGWEEGAPPAETFSVSLCCAPAKQPPPGC
jgi:inhibitor of cysteine peptidase